MSNDTLTKWFCEKCGYVWSAKDPECCGNVVEYNSAKHESTITTASNGWINFWKKWNNDPVVAELAKELGRVNNMDILEEAMRRAVKCKNNHPPEKLVSGTLNELLSRQNPEMVKRAKERAGVILEEMKQKELTNVQKYCRPGWDEYFTNQLSNIASRSTCLRRQIGAIITVDNVIVSTGYNGSPFGFDHCTVCAKDVKGIESGKGQNECYACHSEMNAIAACASSGSSCKGGTIYISVSPCAYCAKLLIQSKIKRIVYVEHYPDVVSFDILNRAGIEVVQFKKG